MSNQRLAHAALYSFVIPAEAGIQLPSFPQAIKKKLDPRFRGDDGNERAS